MRNRCIVFIAFFTIIIPLSTNAQNLQNTAILHLHVKNVQHDYGAIFIAVYGDKETFMKERFHEAIVDVFGLGEHHTQFSLPYGKYAISIFHDLNDNEELDKNIVGMPKEPYGFSNNPKSSFGPPDFDAASFKFEKDDFEIEIILK